MDCVVRPRPRAGWIALREDPFWSLANSLLREFLREGNLGAASLNLTLAKEDEREAVMRKLQGGECHLRGVTWLALSPLVASKFMDVLIFSTASLSSLWLGRSNFSHDVWIKIMALAPRLQSLSVDECEWLPDPISGSRTKFLCNALSQTTSLRSLNLRGCHLRDEEMDEILFVLMHENASIKHFLDISENGGCGGGQQSHASAHYIIAQNRKAQVLCERAVFCLLPVTRLNALFPREVLRMIAVYLRSTIYQPVWKVNAHLVCDEDISDFSWRDSRERICDNITPPFRIVQERKMLARR